MSLDCKILEHIENIEQDFRMLDNIFKCMNMYWKGDGADAIINTYQNINCDMEIVAKHLTQLKGILNE